MKKKNIADIIIFILSAELAGAASAAFSGSFTDFFDKYKEPPLLPPSWLFPVVWIILYALMGISAYLVYSSGEDSTAIKKALNIYWLQLALNFSWSIVFFRFELLWVAVAVILALLICIIIMITRFWKIRPSAALINIPYLLWVAFASYLNIAIAVINS